MKTIGLKIALRSPVLLAATPPASNLTETLHFIPGNTVRGVLARRYLDRGGEASDSVFRRLFIAGDARFGFAYPKGAQTIPLSARSCKYDSGFINDEGGHGVVDLLQAGQEEKRCSKCDQAIDYFQGFWDPHSYCKVLIKTRLITRTAIDPTRGSARTGQLYSQRVLEEGQAFYASIELPEDLQSSLASLLNQPFTARLGTGSSRGQGWAEVSRVDSVALSWGLAKNRFQQFLQKEGQPILVVTLLADGFFRDNYLRDSTAPSLQDLAPLGINSDDWAPQFATAYMDTRMVFGFDGEPILLPRQPRLAVAAGSVFLFIAKGIAHNPTIPLGDGIGWIGDGNREGYGLAVLWHPFHLAPEGGVS